MSGFATVHASGVLCIDSLTALFGSGIVSLGFSLEIMLLLLVKC